MKQGFIPDRRNLGGKTDIDNLQKNHLLALVNAKSITHNMIPPFQPVAFKQNNRQKSIGQSQVEFREQYESRKRILSMKKGAINNSQPAYFERKFFIKNRACNAKDIQTQDHQRNIVSLCKRLNDVDYQSEKNKIKMKQDQQRQYILQQKYCSRHDHSLFQSAQDIYNVLKTRPQSASVQNKIIQGIISPRTPSDLTEVNKTSTPNLHLRYGYMNKSARKLTHKRNKSNTNLGSIDNSDIQILDQNQNTSTQLNSHQKLNTKKYYIGSKEEYFVPSTKNSQHTDKDAKQNNGTKNSGEDANCIFQNKKSENNTEQIETQISSQDKQNKHTPKSILIDSQQNQQKATHSLEQAIPFIAVSEDSDPYTYLRRKLLDIIMEFQLYEKEQMINLQCLVKTKNPHLDQQQIESVFNHIISRIDGMI